MDSRFTVTVGDITAVRASVIVNAANSSLLGGGGVDGAIHRVGGPAILAECRRLRAEAYPKGLPTGHAVTTTGGDLPAAYVIHAVGPVWRGGGHHEEDLLERAIDSSFEQFAALTSRDSSVATIAFPAISTGAYGFPTELAFPILRNQIGENLRRFPDEVSATLVLFGEADARAFAQICR